MNESIVLAMFDSVEINTIRDRAEKKDEFRPSQKMRTEHRLV